MSARAGHSASLLPSGKVLVAGGYTQSCSGTICSMGAPAATELYDPAAGTWSLSASLATARDSQTATLLPTGRILIAGGESGSPSAALTSSEIFDYQAGGWSSTGAMATVREYQALTMLATGKVLVSGGYNGSADVSGAELYDPDAGTWTATGSLKTARDSHTSTLLLNGQVLVAGGTVASGSYSSSVELYDPDAGSWSLTAPLPAPMVNGTATLLADGRVLYAGGFDGGQAYSMAEIFNPDAGQWTSAGSLLTARYGHSATLLLTGKVLVAGGYFSDGGTVGTAELFDPASNLWTGTGALITGRHDNAMVLLPDGRVLVAGGLQGANTTLSSVEIYDPDAGIWSGAASLQTARYDPVAALLPNGKVLVAGGYNNTTGTFLKSSELFDPVGGVWTDGGLLTTARYQAHALLLPNGKVLVAGGGYASGKVASTAELYDEGLGATAMPRVDAGSILRGTAGGSVTLYGSGFTGVSEASSGNSQNSPTNDPVVMLEREDNGATIPAPVTQASSTSAAVQLPADLAGGWYWSHVIVNGTPSNAQALLVSGGGNGAAGGGLPSKLAFLASSASSVAAGTGCAALTVQLEDSTGTPVAAPPGGQTVSFTSTSTTGVFTTDSTCATTPPQPYLIAAGSATLVVYYHDTKAATWTLTATGTGLANGTWSIAVQPGPVSSLLLAGFPSPITAGTAGSFMVTARDAYGNTATSYLGTVKFTAGSLGTLPGNYTFVAADNGQHSFSATLTSAGSNISLCTQDTVTTSLGSCQSGITVQPAAASKLTVGGITGATAGTATGFTVTAYDPYNNVATGYLGTVNLSSSDTTASFVPNPYAFTAADQGVHSFMVTFTKATLDSIVATDSANNTITGQTQIGVSAGPMASLTVSGYPASTPAGTTSSFSVTAKDAYGNYASGYRGTVSFTSSDGQAAFVPTSYTFTAADSGIHNGISATLKTAGTQSITATDAPAMISGQQTGIQVLAGAAAKLALSGFPASVAAGTPGGFTVKALDTYGNTATSYIGTVAFTSSDTKATLPANYVFAAADSGSHAFTATLGTMGSQWLTATDTGTATLQGTQSGIQVTPGPPAALTVSGFPSPTAAGASGAFSVEAVDHYGNRATSYQGTVHLSSSDPAAAIPADTPFTSTDQGLHAFSATLKTAGPQSLTATDTLNTGITGAQSSIQVTPAGLSGFTVTGIPSPIGTGAMASPVVTAVDGFGNVVTSYQGTVVFSATDPQAMIPSRYTFVASDSGRHTFASGVAFNTVGSQSLTATDATNPAWRGAQTGIQVVLAPPAIVHDAVLTAGVGLPYPFNGPGRIQTMGGPPASFGACAGGPTGFQVDATTGAVSWTPAAAGAVTPCVTAANDAGSDSYSFTVTVAQPTGSAPVAAFRATPASGPAPLAVSFDGGASTADPSTTLVAYRWTFGDGSAPAYGVSAANDYLAPGGYQASLTVIDGFGRTATATHAILAGNAAGQTPPTAVIQASAWSGPAPLTVSFFCNCQAGSAPILSTLWEAGGMSQQGPTASFTFGPGTQTVRLTVTDSNGLTGTDSAQVVVQQAAQVPPACAISATAPAGLAPFSVTYSAMAMPGSAAITRSVMTLYDGSSTTADRIVLQLGGPGYYPATLLVTDANNLTCSSSVLVTALSAAGDVPPRIMTLPDSEASCGVPYRYAPVASGTLPIHWALGALDGGNLPTAASIDGGTGALTFVPDQASGAVGVILTAQNAAGQDAQVVRLTPSHCSLEGSLGCGAGGAADPAGVGLLPSALYLALQAWRRRRRAKPRQG